MNKQRKDLEKDLEVALAAAGFAKANREKFTISIGRETEIFVSPMILSKRSYLEVDAVVGFENVVLTRRLRALGKKGADLRVCHIVVGNIKEVRDLWGGNFTLHIPLGESNAPAIRLFAEAMQTIVVSKFSMYDSAESVIQLLRLYSQSPGQTGVVVADVDEKLSVLAAH